MSVTPLNQHIETLISTSPCDERVRNDFLQRIEQGRLTRDEDHENHVCGSFFPYNPETHQVFLVHHKKSGLWIAPGGHIDRGESPDETLQREIQEEVGLPTAQQVLEGPFLFTVNRLKKNTTQRCRIHYELWYVLITNGESFHVDDREFYCVKWMRFEQAKKIVTDQCNLLALHVLEQIKSDEMISDR